MSQEYRTGSADSGNRLTEQAARKDMSEPERIGSIDQDQVKIPRHATMLECIIQQEHVRLSSFDHRGSRAGDAIGIGDDGRIAAQILAEHALLVAAAGGLAAVAAHQDRRALAALDELFREPADYRRLPGAARRQVPHGDNGARQSMSMKHAAV